MEDTMEDIRTYHRDEDDQRPLPDDERPEWSALAEDEVPFHIPRD